MVYVRWEGEHEAVVRLVEAKGKLSPLSLKGETVRSEMCGAVFAARLSKFVKENSRYQFTKVYHFIDSMTVLGAINKESYGFSTFYANRVGEIQSTTNCDNWFWVPSGDNPADLITRGAPPSELCINSFWQNGPQWLYLPENEWPMSKEISQKCQGEVIALQRKTFTKITTRSQAKNQAENEALVGGNLELSSSELLNLKDLITVSRFSQFVKLLKTVAIVLVLVNAWISKTKPVNVNTKSKLLLTLNSDQLKKARYLLYKISQIDLPDTKSLAKLAPIRDRNTGLVVTSGRLGSERDPNFKVPILPHNNLSKLLAIDCHNRGHSGVDATMVKLRSIAWVLKGRKIVKAIVYRCVICRKNRKQHLNQVMSDIPDFRTIPNPPFSYCAVDFFGPITVKGEVNKRSTGKVWGCVYTCLSTRAVYVDIARDYATDGFLLVHRKFQSIRGSPCIIYSDPGKNFVGAASELKKLRESISQEEHTRQGGLVGTEWRFHPPDAPHTNGAVEAMVKLVKKAIFLAVGDAVLTFSELQTVVFEASDLVNERPLAISHTRGNDDLALNYICPNQLLLGRASGRMQSGDWSNVSNVSRRTKYVQEVVSKFWKNWYQSIFPSLVIRPKWHVEVRNLEIGDLVMVADQNAIRGDYRLALVSEGYPDHKGRVRQVQVSYKRSDSNKYTSVKRDVRKLVLILPIQEQDAP